MTTEDAKAYLAKREIPQLFESLMTGLMYYRPEDHITYLQDCLRKVSDDGVDQVRWNLFIDSRRKTPLPPITPSAGGENGRSRPMSRDQSFTAEPSNLEKQAAEPKERPVSGCSHGGSKSPVYTRTSSRSSHHSETVVPLEEKRGTPLPPIGQMGYTR